MLERRDAFEPVAPVAMRAIFGGEADREFARADRRSRAPVRAVGVPAIHATAARAPRRLSRVMPTNGCLGVENLDS